MTQGKKPQPHDPKRQPILPQQVVAKYEGPLPPASELERYNQTVPGAGETIINWVAEENRFRHEMIERDIAHQRRMDWMDAGRSLAGLVIGATFALVALIGAIQLAYAGKEVAASVIGSLDIASIAGVFVLGTLRNAKKQSTDD